MFRHWGRTLGQGAVVAGADGEVDEIATVEVPGAGEEAGTDAA